MPLIEQDIQYMAKAIALAKKGRFTTPPNPNIGCIIVLNGQVVGCGYHVKPGEGYAEVMALDEAGKLAKGSTVYITLEPGFYQGNMLASIDALINAGVTRVVCGAQDPNPRFSGQGVQKLRAAGIDVEVGVLESEAKILVDDFKKCVETDKPFVQLKLAASLDGKTALRNGKSKWITSPEARRDVQAFRAQSCAVLSTSKTVIDDNASLNVRWSELPKSIQSIYPESQLRQPLRVILDRQKKLSPDLALFKTDGLIEVVSPDSEFFALDDSGNIDLGAVLRRLTASHQVKKIWVEAGATLAARFIELELVDELIIYLAPKLMGSDGRGLIHLLGLNDMNQAISLDIEDLRMVGPDIRITARVLTNT